MVTQTSVSYQLASLFLIKIYWEFRGNIIENIVELLGCWHISRALFDLILIWQCISVHVSALILCNCMNKLLWELGGTYSLPKTRSWFILLIQAKELRFMLMQTLQEDEIQLKLMMLTMYIHILVLLSVMLDVLSIGRVNCRQKLLYQLQKLNILPCWRLWGRQFL